MVGNILDMLEIAKQQKTIGKYTHIALGKNYLPTTLKDATREIKYTLWQKRK
tara:strand:+ start:4610 stop:4765 length:156 start_codon:yes stop_codon:yes gene_type:complete